MLHFLPHDLINKDKWDAALESSVNAYIYAHSYFLDSLTGNQWDAIISDNYEMIMPLPYRVKYGVKYVYPPAFNQQLGIFYQQKCSNFDLLEFIEMVKKRYRYFEMNFNKFLFNRLPAEIVHSERTNYELEVIDNYEKIYQNYSTNLKRNLKKAQSQNLKVISFVKPEELIALYKTNKGAVLQSYTEGDYANLQKLIYLLMHAGKAEVQGVINEVNTVIAAALFVKSKGRRIFLFSGLSQEGKEKSAMPFLIDQYLRMHQEGQFVFDFEGSDDPGLARFYASFGAKAFQYQQVIINRLPFPFNYLKKR